MKYLCLPIENLLPAVAQGSEPAVAELVRRYGRTVQYHAHRLGRTAEEKAELTQEGILQLILGALTWSPEKGVPFYQYVSKYIRLQLLRYQRKQEFTASVSGPGVQVLAAVRAYIDEWQAEWQTAALPTADDIAEATGLSRTTVLGVMPLLGGERCLDAVCFTDDNGDDISYLDMLPSEETTDSMLRTAELEECFAASLARSSDRDAEIFCRLRGLGGQPEANTEMLAGEYRLTPQRICQINRQLEHSMQWLRALG